MDRADRPPLLRGGWAPGCLSRVRTHAPAPLASVGPTILLKRGEPVSISVANELPEATSVHWHGIEPESYFDGVPGYAGTGKRIAPIIAPGSTFAARFTPPRSGTFMYHSHVDELRQQQAGLTGALLVVDDPAAFDPVHDHVFVQAVPRPARQAHAEDAAWSCWLRWRLHERVSS